MGQTGNQAQQGRVVSTPYFFTGSMGAQAGGNTTFSGRDVANVQLSYTVGFLAVWLNGSKLTPGRDFTATDGSRFTILGKLLTSTDEVYAEAQAVVGIANTFTQQQADARFAAASSTLIGEIKDWPGPELPAKYLWLDASAVSRATYPALMNALTVQLTATSVSGNAVLGTASKDLTALGLIGAKVEGPGILAGATIASVTANSVTLSANATGANAGAAYRIFPHGNGDGATTFNLPGGRGLAAVGRDNMGGTTAGRVTTAGSGLDGTKLGAIGGAENTTLTDTQIPKNATGTFNLQTGSTGIQLAAGGSGHNGGPATSTVPTVPPARVTNFIIYAGV